MLCAAEGGSTVRGIVFDLSRNNVWPAPFTGRCLIHDIPPAAEIVGRTVTEAEQLVFGRRNFIAAA